MVTTTRVTDVKTPHSEERKVEKELSHPLLTVATLKEFSRKIDALLGEMSGEEVAEANLHTSTTSSSEEETVKSLRAALAQMFFAIEFSKIEVAHAQSHRTDNYITINDEYMALLEKNNNDHLRQIKKAMKKAKQGGILGKMSKALNGILGGASILAVGLAAGPQMAAVQATMFILEQTGVMDDLNDVLTKGITSGLKDIPGVSDSLAEDLGQAFANVAQVALVTIFAGGGARTLGAGARNAKAIAIMNGALATAKVGVLGSFLELLNPVMSKSDMKKVQITASVVEAVGAMVATGLAFSRMGPPKPAGNQPVEMQNLAAADRASGALNQGIDPAKLRLILTYAAAGSTIAGGIGSGAVSIAQGVVALAQAQITKNIASLQASKTHIDFALDSSLDAQRSMKEHHQDLLTAFDDATNYGEFAGINRALANALR